MVMLRNRWIRWFVFWPLVIVSGCHLLMTGSPIPLWYLENLNSPIAVLSVTESAIELENGNQVALPFISKVPAGSPVFQAAIAQGVEVSDDGEAWGLIWTRSICGNDPCHWRRLRVNLTDLAAALDPSNVNESILSPEITEWVRETPTYFAIEKNRWHHAEGRLDVFDLSKVRKIRERLNLSPRLAPSTKD